MRILNAVRACVVVASMALAPAIVRAQRVIPPPRRPVREARLGLKAAMEDTTAADQNARVEQQMNLLVQAQRRRADLFENEQKELGGFLTPLQRARFTMLQERLAAQLQKLNRDATPEGP